MNFRALILFAAVAMLGGCYVEAIDDERKPTPPGDELSLTDTQQRSVGSKCRLAKTTGCFEGQIPSSPDIFVEGKTFFDADDLAKRFGELVKVQHEVRDGEPVTPATVDVKLLNPFDRRTFANGFFVAVKGDYAATAEARLSGNFVLNNLPEGEYKVRVSKAIRFEVTETPTLTDPVEPVEPAKAVTKLYCGTLYSENTVDIRIAERIRQVFDDFRLYVVDKECPVESNSGVVLTF